MKKIFFLTLFLLTTTLHTQENYQKEIEDHRAEINSTFADPEKSILKQEDISDFQGLDFFDPNPSLKVKAKFKKVKNGEVVGFATSTKRIAKYREFGKLVFRVDGIKCKLTVYEPETVEPEDPDYLFLLFKDRTNGHSTYGGGRYLNLSKKDITGKEIEVDFNYCYNPYCAYSNRYSCPVPPDCNHLKAKIEAGVKAYAKDH